MPVCMTTTATVKAALKALKANGCRVVYDAEAGTADAFDGETRVYWAIQKGKGGPWIVRYAASDRITWK